MPKTRPLQVFSNDPDKLKLKINNQKIEFSDLDSDVEVPALFLFSPLGTSGENSGTIIENWLQNTRNLTEKYQTFDGAAVMLYVPMVQVAAAEALVIMNEYLMLETSMESISLVFENSDPLSLLAYEAQLYSDTSSLIVIEEALALCAPFQDQEGIEQQIAQEVSGGALRYLRSLKSSQDAEKMKVEALIHEKELLSLQLLTAQDELETRYCSAYNEVGSLEQENQLLLLQLDQVQKEIHSSIELQDTFVSQDSVVRGLQALTPLRRKTIESYRRLLFDGAYYLSQVGRKKTFPFLHYRYRGWKNGHDPHPLFDSEHYLSQINSSFSDVEMPPLLHYIRYGARLNLSTHREFDEKWYYRQYPDVAESGTPPIVHFLTLGWQEGRMPSARFDCGWYLNEYNDVLESGMNPLLHYVLFGKQEGRGFNASSF